MAAMNDDMIQPFVSSEELEARANYGHELLKARKIELQNEVDKTSTEVRRRTEVLERTKMVLKDAEEKLRDINTVLSTFENAISQKAGSSE